MEQPRKSVVASEVLGPFVSEAPAKVASPASACDWQVWERSLHLGPRCSVGLLRPLGSGLLFGLTGVFMAQVPNAS